MIVQHKSGLPSRTKLHDHTVWHRAPDMAGWKYVALVLLLTLGGGAAMEMHSPSPSIKEKQL